MARKSETESVSRLVFYGTVLLIGWLAYRIVQPFLVEIAWAVVLAICLDPVRVRVQPRLGPTRTALLLTLAVLVLLVIPVVFVGATVVAEGGPAVRYLEAAAPEPGRAGRLVPRGMGLGTSPRPVPAHRGGGHREDHGQRRQAAEFLAGQAGGLLKGAANFLFALVITLGVLFFMLRDADGVPGGSAPRRSRSEPSRTSGSSASPAISSRPASPRPSRSPRCRALIGGVSSPFSASTAGVLWGAIMGILALLPLVGATLVWLPAAVWLALSGSLVKGVVLAAVGVLILGNVDNVVRPLLLSGKAQMNTLVLIISLMGGVSAFGFIGIVLGPARGRARHRARRELPRRARRARRGRGRGRGAGRRPPVAAGAEGLASDLEEPP